MIPYKLLQKGVFLSVVLLCSMTAYNAVAVQPNSSREAEHALRQELKKYDRMVRPVVSPKQRVNVSFSAKLVSLIGLDTKQQMATTKFLIVQKWHNPFLVWNPSSYYGLDRVIMNHKEVWVPDIKLQNNPNNPVIANLPLYKEWVTVFSNGTNVWMSLEMFDSECDINVDMFPFDRQNCSLDFSSESYDSNFLGIDRTVQSKEDWKSVSSGEWDIIDLNIDTEEKRRDFLPGKFVNVVIKLYLTRRRTFYVLYYLLPCVVLILLMFISFVIPPDTGERIGFCSSLLLALSVYLLLFSELLPNTRHISLLGALFVTVFLETALALLATVVVLKAFHSNNEVPTILSLLCCLGCARNKDKRKKKKSNVTPITSTILKRFKPTKSPEPNAVQLEEFKTAEDMPELTNTSANNADLDEQPENMHEENQRRWSRVARRLDQFFFWIFVSGMSASVIYIIVNAEIVTNLNI